VCAAIGGGGPRKTEKLSLDLDNFDTEALEMIAPGVKRAHCGAHWPTFVQEPRDDCTAHFAVTTHDENGWLGLEHHDLYL
jgi:hypothetical protein